MTSTPAPFDTNPKPESTPTLVGIDVGGTFTDFVVLHQGRLQVHKMPTTPQDQSEAIARGLDALGCIQATIVHGMTVATNALLERKGAKTALLATDGFADVLIIGRQNRPHIYQLRQTRPEPLVAADLRFDVPERIDADGKALAPPDAARLDQIARHLVEREVESVAIAFLFSFRNANHEQVAAARLRALAPELPLSLSSEILPEYREYERTATTVINAYVQPLVARYLERLARRLDQRAEIRVMQSNGGAMGLKQAGEQAARLVLSGPAGGVVGAFAVARQAQNAEPPHIITFDMGGTSTDVALCPGAIPTTAEGTITDLPLRLPIIDIHTVGAGGGSIAYVDAGGALRAGPQSAGALPGPACYGRGGTQPTVTDANLVLGRLDAQGFLGGSGAVQLDIAAAQQVLTELGQPLGLGPEEAALGVIRVANATMERALRQVSVERGHDPRRFTLLPFGGAGPLHACDLADALAIQEVFIPPMPGVLSAYGMLVADVVHDQSQTVLANAESLCADPSPLRTAYARLAQEVAAVLRAEQVAAPRLEARLDLRYRGQSYELTVPCALIPDQAKRNQAKQNQIELNQTQLDRAALEEAIAAFHAAHAQRYGYAMPQEPVEVVNLRVRGVGPGAEARLPRAEPGTIDASAAHLGEKPVWFAPTAAAPTAIYDRALLRPNNRITGPALIYQYDATVLITPGWAAWVDEYLNLRLEKKKG